MKTDKINLKDLLPEEPIFIGKKQYQHSVVIVLFVKINEKKSVIFQKRSQKIRQGGEICFPGGRVDSHKDKNIFDTALRETYEEIGIQKKDINLIGHFGMIINPLGNFIDVVIGEIVNFRKDNLNLNEDEVEKLLFIPFDFFLKNHPKLYHLRTKVFSKIENEILFPVKELNIPKRYENSWGGQIIDEYVYQTQGETIWGLTAEIIKEIAEKFKEISPNFLV